MPSKIAQVEFKNKGRTVRYITSNENPDHINDIVLQKGINIDHFFKNTDHYFKFEHNKIIGTVEKAETILDANIPYHVHTSNYGKSKASDALLILNKEKFINEYSLAFEVNKNDIDEESRDGYRIFTQSYPFESSQCYRGMHPETETLGFKSKFMDYNHKISICKTALDKEALLELFPEDEQIEAMQIAFMADLKEVNNKIFQLQDQKNKIWAVLDLLHNIVVLHGGKVDPEAMEKLKELLGIKGAAKTNKKAGLDVDYLAKTLTEGLLSIHSK